MKKERQRTMLYRRASWVDGSGDIQQKLKTAHGKLTTTKSRTFSHGDGEMQCLAFSEGDGRSLFHVAYYVPEQPTSLVPFPSQDKSKDASQQAPPDSHNFMEGDIFFLVRGNHLVLCPSGASEGVAVSYINHVLRKTGNQDIINKFSIEPIADVDQVQLLHREGVKKVQLESSLYEATEEYSERTTTKKTLLNSVARELLELFGKDKDPALRDIQEAENLTVKLEISFDSRRKGGEVGRKRIEKTAEKLIADDEGQGFKIVTGSGKTVSATQIRVSEKTLLLAHGKSVMRNAVWSKLSEYLQTLKQSGILEQ